MPFARIRRVLTSSSTQSDTSITSSTTTSSNTSILDFSINTSTSPRDISAFDLPLLSRSPTQRNTSPRDVFPSSPKEAGFTNSTSPAPCLAPAPSFKKREIKHKRTSSRFSSLRGMLRREKPHPAEALLKPADPQVVMALDLWGGFESQTMMRTGRRDREAWEGVDPLDDF